MKKSAQNLTGFNLRKHGQNLKGFSASARSEGFTLVELLVVIVIIGILMGVLLVAYQGTRKAARDGKRKAELEQVRAALELLRSDCGVYPPGDGRIEACGVPATCLFTGVGPCTWGTSALVVEGKTYMGQLPKDPLDPTYRYQYCTLGAPGCDASVNSYTLCAYLETGSGSVTGCGGSCGGASCNYKLTPL